ncbi:hypothetical protein B0H16DRAFT_1753039 [Mycena metata]|uniref:Uncharacterized protein n=1 Tax=Mycena metata TaxID=1033252 RepID=A0AAD7GD10_9AGAR|nr:hypothetical protein B0H16DRAFT_1753039 [Mycena metata]
MPTGGQSRAARRTLFCVCGTAGLDAATVLLLDMRHARHVVQDSTATVAKEDCIDVIGAEALPPRLFLLRRGPGLPPFLSVATEGGRSETGLGSGEDDEEDAADFGRGVAGFPLLRATSFVVAAMRRRRIRV